MWQRKIFVYNVYLNYERIVCQRVSNSVYYICICVELFSIIWITIERFERTELTNTRKELSEWNKCHINTYSDSFSRVNNAHFLCFFSYSFHGIFVHIKIESIYVIRCFFFFKSSCNAIDLSICFVFCANISLTLNVLDMNCEWFCCLWTLIQLKLKFFFSSVIHFFFLVLCLLLLVHQHSFSHSPFFCVF